MKEGFLRLGPCGITLRSLIGLMNKTVDWEWVIKYSKKTQNMLKIRKVLMNICELYPDVKHCIPFDYIISRLVPDYALEREQLHSDYLDGGNGEGMINPYSLDVFSKINNVNNAIYDYARFYKSWLYSNRNKYYLEKVLLHIGESTEHFKYLDLPVCYFMNNDVDNIGFVFEVGNIWIPVRELR